MSVQILLTVSLQAIMGVVLTDVVWHVILCVCVCDNFILLSLPANGL